MLHGAVVLALGVPRCLACATGQIPEAHWQRLIPASVLLCAARRAPERVSICAHIARQARIKAMSDVMWKEPVAKGTAIIKQNDLQA